MQTNKIYKFICDIFDISEKSFLYSIKQAEVKAYEHQIDQMVYKLYGLTEEEIKFVEQFIK